jgi:hypothetical protein
VFEAIDQRLRLRQITTRQRHRGGMGAGVGDQARHAQLLGNGHRFGRRGSGLLQAAQQTQRVAAMLQQHHPVMRVRP